MCNYMKKKQSDTIELATDEFLDNLAVRAKVVSKIWAFGLIGLCLITLMFFCIRPKSHEIAGETSLSLLPISVASTDSRKDLISIPSGTVNANPFLPYRDVGGNSRVNDVPQFELVAPPEVINEGSDAARVMDTVVSGILYDKYSPSAILNIEGNDYLVKKGDTVNNYKIVAIAQDSVTVKLGNNTYKAGIGEILTEGSLNYNDVANLNKKFGGEKR